MLLSLHHSPYIFGFKHSLFVTVLGNRKHRVANFARG
jgi:hypothetical protein